MSTKKEIVFDELDKKCIEELPLILEVLSTTGNRIANLFSSNYLNNLESYVRQQLKGNRNWKVKKKKDKLFFPFCSDEANVRIEIKELEKYFSITSYLEISTRKKTTFRIYLDYRYNPKEIEENGFCFSIYNWSGWEQNMCKKEFYQKIKNKNDIYSIGFVHPETTDDSEHIYINCKEIKKEKIDEIFRVFKEEILTPFLKTLK